MKKFLSLVLALVMTMSLVTISAGATDFKDDSKINYEEAVSVMSAVKVIDGYADGTFNPQGTLTRGAAAKIICNLILGPTTASALHANTAPFKDVPVDHTFAGYIAYCSEQGIISGYADGAFRPAATLTNYAFLKMLLGALGYDSEIEGFVGENWSIQVAKRALAIGLTKGYEGTFSGTAAATREEACLYALNTLKATMVDYDAKITANVNGATVVVGNSLATDVKWNIASTADGHIKKDGYVQFAEKYFPKLELEVGNGIYGRPANTWKNAKKEIGTFTSIDPTYVYTESTKEKNVYTDLSKAVVEEYDWTAFVNGVEQKKAATPVKGSGDEWVYTGEGTVTEVYVDDDAETVVVVEINYYLGQVSKVKSDDDGEYITVKALSTGAKLNDRTFYVEGYSEDDYVVFTVDFDEDDGAVIGEVCEPETVEAEVTRVDKDNVSDATYLKADGAKYTYTEDETDPAQQAHMVYDVTDTSGAKVHPELNKDYILYLDPNGYVLGFKKAEEEASQYLYVLDADEHLGTWEAKVLLTDGTQAKVELDDELKKTTAAFGSKTIEWKDTKSDNQQHASGNEANIEKLIWKYTVNDKGVYTLTYVKQYTVDAASLNIDNKGNTKDEFQNTYEDDAQIHSGKAYIEIGDDELIVDKQTTFVNKPGKTAYTGYKEVPNVEEATIAYAVDKAVAEVVFILSGEIYDENTVYFFLADESRESLKYDGDPYWEYSKAYVNGTKQPVIVAYDALECDCEEGKCYHVVTDKSGVDHLAKGILFKASRTVDDEYITKVEPVESGVFGVPYAVGDETFWLDGDHDERVKFDTDDDTVFVFVEAELQIENRQIDDIKYTVSTGNIKDMIDPDDADNDDETLIFVHVVKDDDQTAELVYIYSVTVADDEEIPGVKPSKTKYDVTIDGYVITTELKDGEANVVTEAKAIEKALKDADYTDISIEISKDGEIVAASAKDGGLTINFSVNPELG